MLVFVCQDCMPAALDSFDGPEDERECICCLQHKVCREADVSDIVRTAAQAHVKGSAPSSPAASKPVPALTLTTLGLPPIVAKAGR
jgi:hypothetical protein